MITASKALDVCQSVSSLSVTSHDPPTTHLCRCGHQRGGETPGCTRSRTSLWCSHIYAGSLRCEPGTRQYLRRKKQTHEATQWNVVWFLHKLSKPKKTKHKSFWLNTKLIYPLQRKLLGSLSLKWRPKLYILF